MTKIDPSLLTQVGLESEATASRKSRPGKDQASAAHAGSDIQVKLSPTLQSIEKTLAALEVNRSRVDAIKQALARGEYQINPERIANGLVNSALQTLVKGE